MNCWVVPLAIAGAAGVTAIDLRVAAVTVRVVVPLPLVAVTVVEPTLRAVARPLLPEVLLIVATAGVAEVQLTILVRFCVEPSL